jgi:hypothetical protein
MSPSNVDPAGMTEAVGNVVLPDEAGHCVVTDGCGHWTPPDTCHDTVDVRVVVVLVLVEDLVLKEVVWAAAEETSPSRTIRFQRCAMISDSSYDEEALEWTSLYLRNVFGGWSMICLTISSQILKARTVSEIGRFRRNDYSSNRILHCMHNEHIQLQLNGPYRRLPPDEEYFVRRVFIRRLQHDGHARIFPPIPGEKKGTSMTTERVTDGKTDIDAKQDQHRTFFSSSSRVAGPCLPPF